MDPEIRLADLVARWQAFYQQGRHVPAAELCRDCPELAPELERWIASMKQMGRFQDTAADTAGFSSEARGDAAPPPPPPGPLPSFTGYDLLGELGRGGMGVVYKARDRRTGQVVALKTLQGMTPQGLYRFKQEFRALAGVTHPNLIALYELVADGEQWFFTMELVEGVDFLTFIRGGPGAEWLATTADQPAPPSQAGRVIPLGPASAPDDFPRLRRAFRQLAEGVLALHAAGKLHRDIKPRNVLVTPAERVTLLDFGLAAELDRSGVHDSADGSILGTVAYMSPEQAASEPLSPATDWYSVGVMLYEALTGQLPFRGSSLQILQDKQRGDPPPPGYLAPDVPPDLDALCADLLRRDPAARPSGREVIHRLGVPEAAPAPPVQAARHGAQPSLLLGRQRHLDTLDAALRDVQARWAVSVYVHGHSGMGKSSLVQHFLDGVLARPGAVVLSGRCYQSESVPFKAFDSLVDSLARYLARLAEPDVQALLPRDVFALARVFPVLLQVDAVSKAPRLGGPQPEAQELRRRAFAALRELLARLADRKLLVLCIDDLQWGDLDSAALLTELVRPPDAPVLLLLACYRTEEAAVSPCLQLLLRDAEESGPALERRELVVDALTETEARDLARALIGREGPAVEAQAAVIARESGGNPFFVHELVEYVRAGGGSLPAGELTLERVLWERVLRLPEDARRLLEVLAVAGQPLGAAEACAAADVPAAGRPALTVLRSGRLVRGSGAADEERLEAYHDQIRESVVAHLAPPTRAGHHRRLAAVLEAGGRVGPEVLAVHHLGAGELEAASTHYTRAADQAAAALAFDRAANLYRTALGLYPDGAENRQLRARLADALANAGRGAEAAAEYLAAARGADDAEVLHLERRASHQYLISGHVDEGLGVFRSVLGRVGMSMPERPVHTLAALLLGRLRLRLRGLRFRPRPAEQVPERDLTRIDVCWAAFTGLSMIDTIRGAYFQTRGLLMALRAGEPFRVARSLAMEAGHVSVAGGPSRRRVAQLLAAAEGLIGQVDDPYVPAVVTFARGVAGYLEGRWRHSLELCDRSEAMLRAHCTGVAWELDTARTIALWDLIRLGDFAELSRRWPPLLAEAQERGDRYAVTNLSTHIMTVVRLAADEPRRAAQQLRDVMGRWSQQGFHIQHHNALRSAVEIALYCGRAGEAWRLISAKKPQYAGSLLRRIQQTRIDVEWWHARSALAVAADAIEPGPYLKVAEACARRIARERMPWGDALARLVRAGVAARRGRTADAAARLTDTAARLDALDMRGYAAAARARLGGLLGGDEGRALVDKAHAWMASQQVRNPVRMIAMLMPGYGPRELAELPDGPVTPPSSPTPSAGGP